MGRKRRIRHADTSHLEKEEEHTVKSFMLEQLNKFFVQHLPMESLKEFPTSYMYYVGTIAYMAMIGTFVYFTYASYLGSIQQAFIALDPSSGDCSSVPIAISNTYLADSNGNWVGTPHFTYSLAPYSLSLSNFKVSSFDEYQAMMNTFYDALESIGEISTNHSLSYNLIVWASWIRYYSTSNPYLTSNFTQQGLGQLQYIQMTGQPSVIFNTERQQAVISSPLGLCNVTGFTSYDGANGRISTSVNYTLYSSHVALCMASLNPLLFGFTPAVDNDMFTYGLDVNSFSTAMAVNFGILRLEDLGIASPNLYHFVFNGVEYNGRQYFDLRYPYMTPILCISNASAVPPSITSIMAQRLCFVVESSAVTLPTYHHFGVSFRYPIPCFCGAEYDNIGSTLPCQVFNMLSSLIYFEPVINTPIFNNNGQTVENIESIILEQVINLMMIVMRYETYTMFTHFSYNASWSAAAAAYGHKAAETLTPVWQEKAFAFCTTPKGVKCSIATFNSYNAINRIVSEYKYQLNNASCTNSFTINPASWSRLVNIAPAQLTQDYYACLPTASSAFLNALGIATGNTQLIVPFAVLATIPLVYLFLVLIQRVPPKEEYSTKEKEEVMEIVAIILLRLRDGKSRGIRKQGVLMRLTHELISAAKEEVGYPDSDDDDEDYDTDNEETNNKQKRYRKRRSDGSSEDGDSDEEEEEEEEDSDDEKSQTAQNHIGASLKNNTQAIDNRSSMIDSDDEVEVVNNNNNNNNLPQAQLVNETKSPTTKKGKTKSITNKKRHFKRTSAPPEFDDWAANNHNNTNNLKLKKASKMAVFTRQLEEDITPTATTEYYPGKYLVQTVRNIREQVAAESTATLSTNKRKNKKNKSSKYHNDKNSSKQSSWRATEEGAEMSVLSSTTNAMHSTSGVFGSQRKLIFRIIAHEGIPPDCIILNALDRTQVQHVSKKPIKDFRAFSQSIDDLLKQAQTTFAEADANPRIYDMTEDLQRADSPLFQLSSLSMRLCFVDFDFFLTLMNTNHNNNNSTSNTNSEEITMTLLKLSNAMVLHASVLLQVTLKETERLLQDRVGYNVGGRFVTPLHVTQIITATQSADHQV